MCRVCTVNFIGNILTEDVNSDNLEVSRLQEQLVQVEERIMSCKVILRLFWLYTQIHIHILITISCSSSKHTVYSVCSAVILLILI